MSLQKFGLTTMEGKHGQLRKQGINRITGCKMKFVCRAQGYTKWNHKRKYILDKPKIKSVIGYIQNYQRKWKELVNRMNT